MAQENIGQVTDGDVIGARQRNGLLTGLNIGTRCAAETGCIPPGANVGTRNNNATIQRPRTSANFLQMSTVIPGIEIFGSRLTV